MKVPNWTQILQLTTFIAIDRLLKDQALNLMITIELFLQDFTIFYLAHIYKHKPKITIIDYSGSNYWIMNTKEQ